MYFLLFFLLNISEAIFLNLFLPENYTSDYAAIILIFINSIVLICAIMGNRAKIKKIIM